MPNPYIDDSRFTMNCPDIRNKRFGKIVEGVGICDMNTKQYYKMMEDERVKAEKAAKGPKKKAKLVDSESSGSGSRVVFDLSRTSAK